MWKRGRPLGRGQFGFVSLAILHPINGGDLSFQQLPTLIAVKSAENLEPCSLQNEWKLLSRLDGCPQILRCFGHTITLENGVLLCNVFLEYAAGGSLADRIRSSGAGLPYNEVKLITRSILLGLTHIHSRGYVHCDIKPQNILLVGSSPTGRKIGEATVKIADFGLAKRAGKDAEEGRTGRRGTPLYLAPESVLFGEYEPHCDIWALGCTVLQMITGQPPWRCDQNTEVCALLFRIGFTKQVPEIPGWVSKEAEDFLRKCLVRDAKSRWTADMLLRHPFVSSVMMTVRELTRQHFKKF